MAAAGARLTPPLLVVRGLALENVPRLGAHSRVVAPVPRVRRVEGLLTSTNLR